MDSKLIALKDFGYQFLGPMCGQYFRALKQYIQQSTSHDEAPSSSQAKVKLVFLAREGYFFKQAYDELVQRDVMPNIPRCYLRVSRTFLFRICITDASTWDISLGHNYSGKLEDLLTHRFGFSGNQARRLFSQALLEEVIELPQDIERVKQCFEKRIAQLRDITMQSRMDYLAYLKEMGLMSLSGAKSDGSASLPLMIDVGYSGTIQKLLTILLNSDTAGLYFMTTRAGEYHFGNKTARMHSVFQDEVSMGDGYALLDRSLFLESLLTSPNGQFLDIYARDPALKLDQHYQFVYGRESYAQTHFFELACVHQGAIDALVHNFKHDIEFSQSEIEELFEQYTSHRHMMPAAAFPLFDVDDAISGNGNVNPMQLFRL